jgi:hypothetical protein
MTVFVDEASIQFHSKLEMGLASFCWDSLHSRDQNINGFSIKIEWFKFKFYFN